MKENKWLIGEKIRGNIDSLRVVFPDTNREEQIITFSKVSVLGRNNVSYWNADIYFYFMFYCKNYYFSEIDEINFIRYMCNVQCTTLSDGVCNKTGYNLNIYVRQVGTSDPPFPHGYFLSYMTGEELKRMLHIGKEEADAAPQAPSSEIMIQEICSNIDNPNTIYLSYTGNHYDVLEDTP